MMNRTLLLALTTTTFLLSNCKNPTSNTFNTPADLDTTKVLEMTVQYLFDSKQLPKVFADTPLMLIRSEEFKAIKSFRVNGKPVIFLAPSALSDTTLINWQNPKPVMEIRAFKAQNDTVVMSLMFNTVNQEYRLLAIRENNDNYQIEMQGVREY